MGRPRKTETSDEPVVKTAAFRLNTNLLEHLDYAKDMSGVSKTHIVQSAITEYLNKKYPIRATR